MKLIRHVLAMLLVAGATLFVISSSTMGAAEAANGCAGTRTVSANLTDNQGYLVATIEGYEASNGTWCTTLVSQGRYRGVSKYMSLKVCDSMGGSCHSDAGNYQYYAGPVYGPFCSEHFMVIKNPSGTTILNTYGYFGCN